MKLIVTTLTVLFAISALGQTGELIKPNPSPVTTLGDSTDKVAKVPSATDDQRISKLLNNLAIQSGWFPQMKIGVSGGVVSLEGHVKDSEQLAWLAKTADRLPTVIAVINKASVDQPPVTDLSPAWNEFMRLVNKAKRSLPLFLMAAVLITVGWFFSRTVYNGVLRVWGRSITNPFLLSTVSKITMIPIWLLLFYMVLQTAGLSGLATTIIGGTGALGIVLGFAFKDIAENYISGLLLAIRSPFTKGDDVNVAGFDGYVQALNMRGTTILAYDGTLILVPNSIVIKSIIQNRTANPPTRLAFDIGIGYDDSISKATELVTGVLKGVPEILSDPSPLVAADKLTDSTVNLRVLFWIDSTKSSTYKTRSKAISCAKEILLANGVSLPDPAREIVFTEPLRLQRADAKVDSTAGASSASKEDQRKSDARTKAQENLSETRASAPEAPDNHEAQIKKLAENVDIMHTAADRELIKNDSV